ESVYAARRVFRASLIAIKRTNASCGVVGAGSVVEERLRTVGRIVAAGLVMLQGIKSCGRVVVAEVAPERLKTASRIITTYIVMERTIPDSRVVVAIVV